MKALRARLTSRSGESGIGLIEVIIAMMVFAIIATAIGYSMIASLHLTQDSKARQQAANLASQEIDLTRSIDNLFNLVDRTTVVDINGVTYTIDRKARWVSDPGVDQRCGIGGGILRYKRVNVTVAWSGMTSDTPSVHADTLIDPGVRINDPSLGTVLISVTNSSGEGVAGVSVSVTPATPADGATSLATQPVPTDTLGCTYALMVDPGNYDVAVSKSGYVDITQNAAPSTLVSVAASSASGALITLDQGSIFPISYPVGTVIPANLDVSFVSTYGTSILPSSTNPATMFPFPAGYEVLAGMYNDPATPSKFCKSVDPLEWAAGNIASVPYLAGVRPDPVAAVPGGTSLAAQVPMGVLDVTMPSWSGSTQRYLVAISQSTAPAGTADPGCGLSLNYNFGMYSKSTVVKKIALPFGSWKLYASTSANALTGTTTQINTTVMTPFTPAVKTAVGFILTLDARKVAP